MSRLFGVLLAALALAAVPTQCRTLFQAATPVKWCIPAATNPAAVAACTAAVARANSAAVSFSCVAGGSEEGCMQLIANRSADLTTLGGGAMLQAHETYQLEPIAAEFYGELQGANYYSVAVVPASFCTAGVTLASLKGKRSCHTGYRRTAGWSLPVGYLAGAGVMPPVNSDSTVNADAQSVAAFFSATCAPSEDGALTAGGKWDGVCTACTGDCSATDPYYDYPGSLRCMMEGAGDVSFTKHSTAINYASDGASKQTWSTLAKADMRLLCPAGGCKTLDEFETCHVGKAPAYAVMTRADVKGAALGESMQTALQAAGANATILAGLINIPNTADGFAFSENAKGILPVDSSFLDFFGANTKAAYEGVLQLEEAVAAPAPPTPAGATPTPSAPAGGAANAARWCIPFPADAAFLSACSAAAAKGNTTAVSFDCVVGGTQESCLAMVAAGEADLIVLGGSEMLPAHEEYKLEPLAAEYYGDLAGASYYSVAVVPKEFCTDGVTMSSLKGKRSCNTGYRRTAGWTMPVGFLTETGVIPREDSNDQVQADAESVAAFFSATCAAGSNDDGPNVGGGAWEGMCTACKGDCSSSDPYFDYPGSLRCLMEGAGKGGPAPALARGDVAFTKHATVLEYAQDGTEAQPWSTKSKADLMLLCPSGGCATVDQFENCNIAKVPARGVMSRAEMQTSTKGLTLASASTPAPGPLPPSPSLQSVDVPFMPFYGASTKQAYDGMVSLDELAAAGRSGAPAASGSSSGVSSGAAAGIGIGCAVAGALLGAAAMMWVGRRRGWKRHNDAPVMAGSAHAPSDAYKL
ncbi:hypothetical protein ABPG75_002281 [Micractinium tetrahymenae]